MLIDRNGIVRTMFFVFEIVNWEQIAVRMAIVVWMTQRSTS